MATQSRTNPYASLSTPDSGQIQPGTNSTTPFPDKPCKLAKFKAGPNNTGTISIGKIGLASGDNANGGLILSAREDSGWWPITNINKVGARSTVAGDWVEWVALK